LSPNLLGAFAYVGTFNRIYGNSENNVAEADNNIIEPRDDIIHMQGTFVYNKPIQFTGSAFGDLGTAANGSFGYCIDCKVAAVCVGGGTGAFAKRLNGVWVCN